MTMREIEEFYAEHPDVLDLVLANDGDLCDTRFTDDDGDAEGGAE